jgi:hypothetical protein
LAQTCRVTYIENAREVARNKKFWQLWIWERRKSKNESHTGLELLQKLCVHQRSRFNLHEQRNYGRYLKGSQEKAVVSTVRGVSIINLGGISQAESWTYHWRNLSSYNYKEEEAKWEGSSCGERSNRNPTEQYLAYLWNAIGVLDRKHMSSHYLLQQRYVILLKIEVMNVYIFHRTHHFWILSRNYGPKQRLGYEDTRWMRMINWLIASATRYRKWPDLTVKHDSDMQCPSSRYVSLRRGICKPRSLVVYPIRRMVIIMTQKQKHFSAGFW